MPYIHKIFDAISDSISMRIFKTVASKDKNGVIVLKAKK
jgi:hypothetical protein